MNYSRDETSTSPRRSSSHRSRASRIFRQTGLKVKLPRDYSEQTYASPYAIVRYPHQKRLRTAVDHILSGSPARLLDYGAGEGQMLIEALAGSYRPDVVVAFEPTEKYARHLQAKLVEHGLEDRVEVVTERAALDGRAFDYIACLGVLEHMPLNERNSFYSLCEQTLEPGGLFAVDIPVEIGPTLLVKSLARVVLKGRNPEYSPWELLKISVGAKVFDPARFDPSSEATWIQDHKGFDYRLLREEAEYRFRMIETKRTPVGRLPAPLGNQEIFCSSRPFPTGKSDRGEMPNSINRFRESRAERGSAN